MSGYTKLFTSILASTIWREPDHVRVVWITMLAMVNARGIVEASVPGLADMARVSVEKCEEALAVLRAPDPYSRTKDNEGRRIRDVEGGFALLNYGKYRDTMSADDRREYQRAYRSKYRQEGRDKARSTSGQHWSTRSTDGQSRSTGSIHAAATATASSTAEADNVGQNRSALSAAGAAPASQSDSEWLAGLKTDPAYSGIDIDRERAKMARWCKENRKQPTRRRFTNWLNRADRNMALIPAEQPVTTDSSFIPE